MADRATYARPAIGVRRPAGKGSLYPDGTRRIVIAFDEETFAEVRGIALRENSSFAAQIRQLVEEALLDRAENAKGARG
ncbi:hypothetical protein [Methylosinus sp. PW1]|uniref:hypothetical protein n=1 Tax=Methylosinus sp. PW1 TaxID=107636 RepID=UPI000561824E|nr:hypothetical protein [Methylosinus sp. PW1]